MSSLEELFGKLAMTTVTTVSRIALNHATNAAIRNVSAYIQDQHKTKPKESRELESLKRQLDLKIKNLKPTIDIIARGVADDNKDLEPALEMCTDLTSEINQFKEDLAGQLKDQSFPEDYVQAQLKRLLANIDDVVPSLHLALRNLEASSDKPKVSRSKLVQASSILQKAKQAESLPATPPSFSLRLYSLFTAGMRHGDTPNITWKEEFHKCNLTLQYLDSCYTLLLTEDINDGLYHEEAEEGKKVGKSLRVDVQRVKRMYYTRSGQLLNIEKTLTPVLVLKVLKAEDEEEDNNQQVRTTESKPEIGHDDVEEANWYAVEIYPEDSDEDEEDSDDDDSNANENASLQSDTSDKTSNGSKEKKQPESLTMTMSLLLLESVIKLCLLETTEQMDHLSASDELIDLYMS